VQKKREWVRKSCCAEGQQATGRESVKGEESLLTSVVSTCVFLCFLLISCFALVDEVRTDKKYSLAYISKHYNLKQSLEHSLDDEARAIKKIKSIHCHIINISI
jgi:hypothetical protein